MASAAYSVLTPIPVWRILSLFSSREESERAFAGSVESQQLYPKVVYSYGQTPTYPTLCEYRVVAELLVDSQSALVPCSLGKLKTAALC